MEIWNYARLGSKWHADNADQAEDGRYLRAMLNLTRVLTGSYRSALRRL